MRTMQQVSEHKTSSQHWTYEAAYEDGEAPKFFIDVTTEPVSSLVLTRAEAKRLKALLDEFIKET